MVTKRQEELLQQLSIGESCSCARVTAEKLSATLYQSVVQPQKVSMEPQQGKKKSKRRSIMRQALAGQLRALGTFPKDASVC